MSDAHFDASYLVETPLPLEKVAEIMAGEQSCGTFTRVEGETDELRERARATVSRCAISGGRNSPPCRSAWLDRKGVPDPSRRGEVVVRFPVANVGINLPTLAATVAGNLFDLGEVTGLRLESLQAAGHLPQALRPAAARRGGNAPLDRSGARPADRFDHQAQCRIVGRGDRGSGRAAVRGRARLHQG